jgi:hypothetical protein
MMGMRTKKRAVDRSPYEKLNGTLGFFAETKDNMIVAVTAGHCINHTWTHLVTNERKLDADVEDDFFVALPATIKFSDANRWKCMYAENDAPTDRPGMMPTEPPSSLDTIDCGYWIVADDLKINSQTIGFEADWLHARHDGSNFATWADADPISFSGTIATPTDNMLVFKFGVTSRLTLGLVLPVPLYQFVPHEPHKGLRTRLRIQPYKKWTQFAQKGDSGALVFDKKWRRRWSAHPKMG